MATRSLNAFHRHILALRPTRLETYDQLHKLTMATWMELPYLRQPPFVQPGRWPLPVPVPTRENPGGVPLMDVEPDGAAAADDGADPAGMTWLRHLSAHGDTTEVQHDGVVLRFGVYVQYMLSLALGEHRTALGDDGSTGDGRPYLDPDSAGGEGLRRFLGELAAVQAATYVAANPEARILSPTPPGPGMYDDWPPAQPTGDEPPMDDGSHLLASERGRRRIDPETGKRMIRTMVMPDGEWPHWEWSEDVEGPGAVGPWGPDVSFGTPDEPAQMSPRESMRPHLTRIGRLDLLHKYAPWEGDPPL